MKRMFLLAAILLLVPVPAFAQNRYFPDPYPQYDAVMEALDVYMQPGHPTAQWPELIVAQIRRNPVAGGPLDRDCGMNAWGVNSFTGMVDGWGSTVHSTPGGLNTLSGNPNPVDESVVYWKTSLEVDIWQYDYQMLFTNASSLDVSSYQNGSTAGFSHDSLYCAVDFTNGFPVNQGNSATLTLEVWVGTAGWAQINQSFDPIEAFSVGMRAYYSDAILDHDWAVNGLYLLRWHLFPNPGSSVPEEVFTFSVPKP